MKTRSILCVLAVGPFALLACAGEREEAAAAQSDIAIAPAPTETCTATPANGCGTHRFVSTCLHETGCSWMGDAPVGHECVYTGVVVPQTVGADVAKAPACVSHGSEACCLADQGCAWGDFGHGAKTCVYVGTIVPQ